MEGAETFEEAGLRETMEEAGIAVRIRGLLRIENSVMPSTSPPLRRQRVVLFAEPADLDAQGRTEPTFESLQASWMSVDNIRELKTRGELRGDEPLMWATYLDAGGPIWPLAIMGSEGAEPAAPSELRVFHSTG